MKQCEGYPKELLEYETNDLLGFSLNGATLDMKNMRIVKISEDQTVMWAYYGFYELSE